MICFFGGRADLWPPLQNTVDRLTPRPPELLAILSKTFSDPARLTPDMLARADASVADLGQQVSPARIIRTGIAVAYLDRLSSCREPLQRAIQHGREGGAVTSAIEALFLLGQDAFHTGRWDEAQQLIDEGLQLCDTHGYQLLTWPGRLTAALLSAARGDSKQATDTARDMDAWAVPRRAGIIGAYAAAHPQPRRPRPRRLRDRLPQRRRHQPTRHLRPLRAARPVGVPQPRRSRHSHRPPHRGSGPRRRRPRLPPRPALPAAAPGRPRLPGHHRTPHGHRPQTALEQAITEPGHDRWPFDLARIQLTYGSHLRRIKRTTDARRQLAAAAETFRRLGATPWAARADRELRATGIAVSTADTGLASLTPQQRQIALLAAAGHTNKQIAARLFLSPRTVSTHLHQVFPKLGITSRAALRDALADTSPE